MRTTTGFLIILTASIGPLSGCAGNWSPYEDDSPAAVESTAQIEFVTVAELYRNAPPSSTEHDDWQQWENDFLGRHVKGKGTFDSVSIHPQEGKLFFVATALGEGAPTESSPPQVALLIEDAHTIALGEAEGSFLIDQAMWINLGESYAFEGTVSGVSLFDPELSGSGYGDLIIVSVSWMDIGKE